MKQLGLTISLLVLLQGFSNAQGYLKKLEDKVKAKTEERVDEGIDKVLDYKFKKNKKTEKNNPDSEPISQEEESSSAENQDYNNPDFLKKMLGSKNCNAKESYNYSGYVTYRMEQTGAKEKDSFSMNMKILTNEKSSNIAMIFLNMSNSPEMKNSKFIIDSENNLMLILMNTSGQKMGICSPTETDEEEDDTEDDQVDSEWTVTGKSKLIKGKSCTEYIRVDNSLTQRVWVDASYGDMSELSAYLKSNKKMGMGNATVNPHGLVYESYWKDTNNKTEGSMIITDLNEHSATSISTSEYSIF